MLGKNHHGFARCGVVWMITGVTLCIGGARTVAQDHPILTEVYNDPTGISDGPVGHRTANPHQEFIELYLPMTGQLHAALNKDALNLTIYAVEGDTTSSGYTLVNYRIDLPPFDLDSTNGITNGAIERPASGMVVIGWVDYVYGDTGTCAGNGASCSVSGQTCADLTRCISVPTNLAGTPGARVALVEGGVTSTNGYVFIALNGSQFAGTTNFPTPLAISHIALPHEANSGIIQNGSDAYLLVNRDAVGYVELYDDKDPTHQPPIPNADPALPSGNVLRTSCLLDGFAGNDHDLFEVLLQPYPNGEPIDLANVLPAGGAFSLLIPQIAEGGGNGYLRLFGDMPKTTEDGVAGNASPAVDAVNAYRITSDAGPWFPTPGRATFTNSPPALAVADAPVQTMDVLAQTTLQQSYDAAHVGGNFAMAVTGIPGAGSAPSQVTFAAGDAVVAASGQTSVSPTIAVTVNASGTDGTLVTAPVTIQGETVHAGDPSVVDPTWTTTASVRIVNPTTGRRSNGQPFQTTVFVAVQTVPLVAGVANELLTTDLGAYLAAQPDISVLDTLSHGAALINAGTNISSRAVVGPMIKGLPDLGEECATWQNPPGPPGRLDFAATVMTSAEVASGAPTYDESIGSCFGSSVIRSIRVNLPDTTTFGGTFTPSEAIHFADAAGEVGTLGSGLTNVTTSRTFEVALIDTNVRFNGSLEPGTADDFGVVIEVLDTEPGAPVVSGEFVFLSLAGGLQGADVDTLSVPPGNGVANIILFDLDNLHSVLGIRSIESMRIIDGDGGSEVDIIEAFSLNPIGGPGCTVDANCSDYLFCNGIERCIANACQPGTPVDCDDGIACTVDSCHEGSDTCDHVTNDAACDNGQFCDGVEQCDTVQGCQAGTNPCIGMQCNESTNACVDCLIQADCDDGVYCNGVEICSGGACQPGTPVDCDDGIACTVDSCHEGSDTCDHVTNDAACDNGQFCDGVEQCDTVQGCQAGTNPCIGMQCNESNNACVDCLIQADCDDGVYCNGVEICSGGACQPGTPVDCDDGIACTVDSCHEGSDTCDHVTNDAACDNGLFCDGAERCDNLLGCQGGTDPCPGEVCDEPTGACMPADVTDLDADGDVDLDDFAAIWSCLQGPDFTTPGCEAADFTGDTDTDLADFASFQLTFTGANP